MKFSFQMMKSKTLFLFSFLFFSFFFLSFSFREVNERMEGGDSSMIYRRPKRSKKAGLERNDMIREFLEKSQ
ncbi:hypothetical protein EYC84_005703 [Monilinia fructicola]|uniref:Uncharacterized protein n=1 Tax=Monilinia fructicola TaxID=38448 RepID=A0A5M9JZW9_MONFR|nr:hypothetical protein EYC84_005703 [Monilinia fructicola]